MKRVLVTVSLLALVGLALTLLPFHSVQVVHGQYVPTVNGQNTLFPSAAIGTAGVVTNSSGFLVSVAPGPMYCSGDQIMVHNTTLGLLANQTWFIVAGCSANNVTARTSAPGVRPTEIPLATVVCGASNCATITATTAASDYPNVSDNFYWLPLGSSEGCSAYLTTGAFAANPANAGALTAPSPVRANASNPVFEVTTSAAASALTLDCKISAPQSKTSTGKGVLVTGLNVFYGVQTSALTSITASPTLNSVTYAATAGGAAAGTVAAAGGALTFTPAIASAQLATTTSGQCYQQNVALTTPVQLNTNNVQLVYEEVFNQTATSTAVYQICGVQVLFQNIPL